MAVPTFVVDAPGGGGKIPITPNYIVSQSDRRLALRNYEGVITSYTQPENVLSDCGQCRICEYEHYKPLDGVAKLLTGDRLCLEPASLERRKRSIAGSKKIVKSRNSKLKKKVAIVKKNKGKTSV
jgi:lysine 2,3-aminomutase